MWAAWAGGQCGRACARWATWAGGPLAVGKRAVFLGPGLAGSLGRSGRGAAKSSDPVGVAGRQKMLGVADPKVKTIYATSANRTHVTNEHITVYATAQHMLYPCNTCCVI